MHMSLLLRGGAQAPAPGKSIMTSMTASWEARLARTGPSQGRKGGGGSSTGQPHPDHNMIRKGDPPQGLAAATTWQTPTKATARKQLLPAPGESSTLCQSLCTHVKMRRNFAERGLGTTPKGLTTVGKAAI